jgi:GNAT superfamily N-acetyltransferase
LSRRIRHLTPDLLARLPESCRSCLFWEVADARPGPDARDPAFALRSKEAWWQAVELEHPTVSRAAFVDDELVGYALVGEPPAFPRARRLGPASGDDALLLGTLWVHPDHRGGGMAKMLVHSVLREAVRSHHRAVEAYGQRGAMSTCVVPTEVLEGLGFKVVADHYRYPLLRLDLRQTASWADSVGQALEGVISALGRRERAPAKPTPARVTQRSR